MDEYKIEIRSSCYCPANVGLGDFERPKDPVERERDVEAEGILKVESRPSQKICNHLIDDSLIMRRNPAHSPLTADSQQCPTYHQATLHGTSGSENNCRYVPSNAYSD